MIYLLLLITFRKEAVGCLSPTPSASMEINGHLSQVTTLDRSCIHCPLLFSFFLFDPFVSILQVNSWPQSVEHNLWTLQWIKDVVWCLTLSLSDRYCRLMSGIASRYNPRPTHSHSRLHSLTRMHQEFFLTGHKWMMMVLLSLWTMGNWISLSWIMNGV